MSTSRVKGAMVNNPVYDGPTYESIQPKYETLMASIHQALTTSEADTLADQPINNSESTNTIIYLILYSHPK